MRTYKHCWLLVICAMILIGCSVKSPSGQIFMTGNDNSFYIYNFDSQNLQKWEAPVYLPSSDASHAWSPDYQQMAYDCYVDQKANLCLHDLETSTSEVLLESGHPYGEISWPHVTWTQDGQGVTFVTTNNLPPLDQHYRQTLYTVDVQTRVVTQLTDLPNALGDVTSLEWISKNELMTGLHNAPGNILIWDAQTWEPRKVAEGVFPHWSSQTGKIVFMRYYLCFNEQTCFVEMPDRDTYWRKMSSRREIYTVDAQGENETLVYAAPPSLGISFSSHGGLFWSPDGEYLAFTGGKGGEMNSLNLYTMRVSDGYIEPLVKGLDFGAFELSWVPDSVQ